MTRKRYCPEIVEEIASYIEQGESNINAAKKAGITEAAFYKWKKEHVEFVERLKRAEDTYRNWELNEVAKSARRSLKQLIEGFEYTEIENEYESDGKGGYIIKKQRSKTKKFAPNATAVIFALCNRDPEHWQNRINADVNSKVTAETKTDLSLANVPDDLLAQVIEAINGK